MDKSILARIKEKYDIENIICGRYGQTFLDFYLGSQKKIIELESVGLYIWELFGMLWVGEKQELILNILVCLNSLERVSLELKKELYNLVEEEKKRELFEKDKIVWDVILSDYGLKNEWLDLDFNWEQLKEKNRSDLDKIYKDVDEKIKSILNSEK
jgi:hypothetical protein